ncbi:MAG TPA: family 78 glycoside hydrolase catalytic domain [Chitinophagaceae bacterium]|nr:family 78 glycoside hydrolase catalytic domain [Chitinophagaceae bacterium]
MRKINWLLLLLISTGSFAQLSVSSLQTENQPFPFGIDAAQPRFSWQLNSPVRNTMQTAYELKVMLDKKAVWQTGKTSSSQSVFISYAGASLESNQLYKWQVRVWDNQGKSSAWSQPAYFHTGLLQPTDWKASWIEAGFAEDSINRPAQYFRKPFSVGKKIKSATAYITALGMYEAQLNGQRIGDAYLTPGWTSYNKRLQYQAYDVTSLLKAGDNALGVTLGNGWYRGFLAWDDHKNIYGKKPALLMQLMIKFTDGSQTIIGSDDSWQTSTGPIRYSEIYHGETYDARAEKTGWASPGYTATDWVNAKKATVTDRPIVATINEPIRKHERFKPVKIFKTPKGELVADFGQNLVGWVELSVKGNAGDQVVLTHTEVLDKAGNFYIANLRAAKQQNKFILKGGAEEFFEPHFTFQGFRYIKVEGFPGELTADNLTAVALYSDMPPTGTFTSSNKLINQLQHNIQWGQKGNFLDVPTDCPQRDERLGWTGDAQVFSRTAAFNFGVNNFFAKWMKDVAADQLENGSVPFVIPNVLGAGSAGSTGWADAATIIPWNMYLAYGDKKILEDQYASMKAWQGFMEKNSKDDLWATGFHFGDWLFYRPFDDNDGRAAVTDKYLIAQCFFAHSTDLMRRTATVLGKTADADYYRNRLERIKAAFRKEYMTANGKLVSGTQTAYTLALQFDMLPEELRQTAAVRLVENVKSYGYHLTTGFLGTPYLCHVLSRYGYADIAYRLLLQETYPSWLYPVKMGATTIWERWDGIKPDSTFQVPSMNSFNHYAYGAIGDWMYRVAAGLDTREEAPGYQQLRIEPHTGGSFTHLEARLNTNYGEAVSGWKISDHLLTLDISIPVNSSALIYLPSADLPAITENGIPVSGHKDLTIQGTENGKTVVKAGSGQYHFEIKK